MISHEPTEEEIKDNNLEEVVEAGEEIGIPVEGEDVPEPTPEPTAEPTEEEVDEAFRICTCGQPVAVPGKGEKNIRCSCGVYHAR